MLDHFFYRKINFPLSKDHRNNLQDHYGVRMVAQLKGVRTFNTMAQGFPLGLEILKWVFRRPSVLSVSPSLVHLFWKSSEKLELPDLE